MLTLLIFSFSLFNLSFYLYLARCRVWISEAENVVSDTLSFLMKYDQPFLPCVLSGIKESGIGMQI
jgi:hypothetical protein